MRRMVNLAESDGAGSASYRELLEPLRVHLCQHDIKRPSHRKLHYDLAGLHMAISSRAK